MREMKNAVISAAKLELENVVLITIELRYGGGSFQAFGAYQLADPYAGLFIRRVLQIAGASSWDELVGRPLRVRIDDKGFVYSIGHFLDDRWFTPREDLSDEPRI